MIRHCIGAVSGQHNIETMTGLLRSNATRTLCTFDYKVIIFIIAKSATIERKTWIHPDCFDFDLADPVQNFLSDIEIECLVRSQMIYLKIHLVLT